MGEEWERGAACLPRLFLAGSVPMPLSGFAPDAFTGRRGCRVRAEPPRRERKPMSSYRATGRSREIWTDSRRRTSLSRSRVRSKSSIERTVVSSMKASFHSASRCC